MIDFKLPVDLPNIDLSSALPLLALVLIAAFILITLLARSIVRSKLIVIALIVAIVMGGSSVIVGGLQALTGLLAVAGLLVIAGLILIARLSCAARLMRDVHRDYGRDPKSRPWPHMIDQPTQLATASSRAMKRCLQRVGRDSRRLPRLWGFRP